MPTEQLKRDAVTETLLAKAAGIICGASCGLVTECRSREAAKALLDAGLLVSAQRPTVSIEPMHLSDDLVDYFVAIKVGDRVVTPHVFREEYKAAYHVALYDWLLNGAGEEPDVVEFGPNDWPARRTQALPSTERCICGVPGCSKYQPTPPEDSHG